MFASRKQSIIFIREDIPSKLLNKHSFPEGIEGLFIEVNFRKSKWLLLGTYHPPSQKDDFYFDSIGRALDPYSRILCRFQIRSYIFCSYHSFEDISI